MSSVLIDANRVQSRIQAATYIAVTVHVNPDGDALGSLLAFYEYLLSTGKKVVMIVDDRIPQKYMQMPFVDSIRKPEMVTDAELIDLLVVLDASTYERIGDVGSLLSGVDIVNIDHHISNTQFADELYLDATCAATGEILTDLFQQWQIAVTPSMANALYMAIVTDCGFFKFSNTTAKTLQAGAYCMAHGADTQAVADIIETTTAQRLQMTAKILNKAAFYADGRIAMLSLSPEEINRVGGDTDGLVDFIRNVENVEVAIVLKGKTSTITRVSLRSKAIDVNAIANHFGGGGHIRAAGCTIDTGIEEASQQIITAVTAALDT